MPSLLTADRWMNKAIFFTVSRYLCFGLLFVGGVLVAKIMGPWLFGIWGFLKLVQQYLSYTNMGVNYAVNTQLATRAESERDRDPIIIGSSIILWGATSFMLLTVGVVKELSQLRFFEKYHLSDYLFLLILITILTHLQQLLINIYRIYGALMKIALSEAIYALSPFSVIFFFRQEQLIQALLLATIGSGILSIAIFFWKPPFRISLIIKQKELSQLLKIGLPLLLYNASFYLILLSTRTIVSFFYTVEDMGYFSLAHNLANATFLGLNALSFVFYPVILSRVREDREEAKVSEIVRRITELYGVAAFLIVFVAITVTPLIFYFLAEYRPVQPILNILFLSQGVLSFSFAFTSLAIARRRQLHIAALSLGSVLVVSLIGGFWASLHLELRWIAFATFIGLFIFSVSAILFGHYLVGSSSIFGNKNFFLGIVIPCMLVLWSNLFETNIQLQWIPLACFLIFLRHKLYTIVIFLIRPLSVNFGIIGTKR